MKLGYLVCATAMVAVSSTSAHEPMIVKDGDKRVIDVPFHETRLILSEAASEGGVSVYEFGLPPRTAGAPPHVHANEDEYGYILEGEVTVLAGEDVVTLGPGDFAALTRGAPHGFWNAGEEPARILFMVSKGGFERFFDAVAVRLREERPASPDAANALVGEIAAAHGITMRPDLMPVEAAPYFAPPAD